MNAEGGIFWKLVVHICTIFTGAVRKELKTFRNKKNARMLWENFITLKSMELAYCTFNSIIKPSILILI